MDRFKTAGASIWSKRLFRKAGYERRSRVGKEAVVRGGKSLAVAVDFTNPLALYLRAVGFTRR